MGEGKGAQSSQQNQQKETTTVLVAAGAGAGVFGCLFSPMILLLLLVGVIVICAIGVVFWPLVIICQIFGCGGGGGGGDGPSVDEDQVKVAFESDGKGDLAEEAVPAEYREVVKKAGQECDQIGAIVIAAQINQESVWDPKLKGPNGKEGISQLPPDKFDEFGEDEDDNDETSALDAEDSIMAQAKYMCSLAKDIDALVANNEVKGAKLDLTLAAYSVGLDAVKQAKGVPQSGGAQSYVFGVRTSFAMYSGAIAPPEGESYPTISPMPKPSSDD
ncbi:transglycosylase SLT domain-containing protein [Streptomyces sp. NPDC054796]